MVDMLKEEVLQKIGKKNWSVFTKWMCGQTVGIKDGELDYYEWDVDRFVRNYGTQNNSVRHSR